MSVDIIDRLKGVLSRTTFGTIDDCEAIGEAIAEIEQLRDVDPINRWTNREVDEGTWCWVTDGKQAWIARRDRSASHGWTNEDTWEDFDGIVIGWMPIPSPPDPILVTRKG
jgi:hypothetical protein